MGGAAAAAAGMVRAIGASGVVVRLSPEEFGKILDRMEAPLVVAAQGGIWRTQYQYLLSYKGLAFFTKSDVPLAMPAEVEMVNAGSIWIPGG